MKWWFIEKTALETRLSNNEIMTRISSIAREKHKLIDTLNPDHVFNDGFKDYVGDIGQDEFRLKRKYYYSRGQTMGLIVRGKIEDDMKGRVLALTYSVPAINLLWFLFPPLWMMIGFAYAIDYSFLHGIPLITLVALLLIFYLYWVVLAQFRRKAAGATADFQQVLNTGNNSFFTFR